MTTEQVPPASFTRTPHGGARRIAEGTIPPAEVIEQWLHSVGIEANEREDLLASTQRVGTTRGYVAPDRVLIDGELIELDHWRLEALQTPAHSPGPVAARATELLTHHDEQLPLAERLVAKGHDTVRAVAERVPWSSHWSTLAPTDRFAAMGEAYAHLVVLQRRDQIELVSTPPYRWHPAKDAIRPAEFVGTV